MTGAAAAINPKQLRNVLGTFLTGVTVVTTRHPDGRCYGVTANSFSSVSLDPPLVLWSQSTTSKSYDAFQQSDHFTVNILAEHQIPLSNHFAKSHDDKFKEIAYHAGMGGAPVLEEVAASFECTKIATYPGGDHVVYLGKVERFGHSGRKPLAFGQGKYMLAYAHEMGLSSPQLAVPLPGQAKAIRTVIGELPRIATELGNHTLCLSVWGNHGPTAIYWEPSAEPVSDQLRYGLVMSMTQSATGHVFAAFLAEQQTKAFIDEDLCAFHDPLQEAVEQRQRFEATVAQVRALGLALRSHDSPSPVHGILVSAFSVPVLNGEGDMIMALTLVTPAHRATADLSDALSEALKTSVQQLEEQLRSTH